MAGNAVAAFKRKVESSWNPPDKPGETARDVSVILDNNGNVTNVSVNASDPAVKASAEKAVRAAAPTQCLMILKHENKHDHLKHYYVCEMNIKTLYMLR